MKTKKDIRYSDISKLDELDIYYADNEKGTIIYFHGGGFTCGSKYDPHLVAIAESFANHGYTFISVNYSLYPDTKFPSYLVEAAKAVGYVCNILKIIPCGFHFSTITLEIPWFLILSTVYTWAR